MSAVVKRGRRPRRPRPRGQSLSPRVYSSRLGPFELVLVGRDPQWLWFVRDGEVELAEGEASSLDEAKYRAEITALALRGRRATGEHLTRH